MVTNPLRRRRGRALQPPSAPAVALSMVALLRPPVAWPDRRYRRDRWAIWKDLFFHTRTTAVGTITSLALAAIDTPGISKCHRARTADGRSPAGTAQRCQSTPPGRLASKPGVLVEQTLAARGPAFAAPRSRWAGHVSRTWRA